MVPEVLEVDYQNFRLFPEWSKEGSVAALRHKPISTMILDCLKDEG